MDDKTLFDSVIKVPEEGFQTAKGPRLDLRGIPPEKGKKIDKILIPESYIQERIKALAQEICRDYEKDEEIYLVTILKGAFVFASDLGRGIYKVSGFRGPEIKFDFIKAVTYGGEIKQTQESQRKVRIELQPLDLEGKDVLLVEDIIDQGFTLCEIKRNLLEKENLNSLKVCVLFNKVLKNPSEEVRELKKKLVLDYLGFEIPDRWIAGYGIDAGGDFRHLPFVVAVKENYYLSQKEE
ncbi:MAG: phosphoribosyltransferase family protein [Candidatus Aminicenantes bacterium]